MTQIASNWIDRSCKHQIWCYNFLFRKCIKLIWLYIIGFRNYISWWNWRKKPFTSQRQMFFHQLEEKPFIKGIRFKEFCFPLLVIVKYLRPYILRLALYETIFIFQRPKIKNKKDDSAIMELSIAILVSFLSKLI